VRIRKYYFWTFGFLLGSIPTLVGQSIRASSGSAAPGKNFDLEISVAPAADAGVSALRWKTTFPAQLLEIANPPETGRAASTTGKSLTCAQPKDYVYVCIIAGGRKSIGAGPIAVFHFKVRENAHRGTATIRVDEVDAVTVKLDSVHLDRFDGQIEIQ
jgi:hypothetical protein